MTETQKNEVISWAIQRLQDYEKEKKLYNLSAIILAILDVTCGIIAMFYAGMMLTAIIASIISGSVWGARFIQLVKAERLAKSLKLLSMPSIAYLATRKKRGEIMKNIKIKNLIIAGLDVVAVVLGIVLMFIEPNIITDNIVAVVTGLGTLLGVNVVIPCFNNAKVTDEDKAKAVETKNLKLAKKEAKAQLKQEQKAQIEDKAKEIMNAKSVVVENANVESQVINAENVQITEVNK